MTSHNNGKLLWDLVHRGWPSGPAEVGVDDDHGSVARLPLLKPGDRQNLGRGAVGAFGAGLRVYGSEFGVQGWGLGLRVQGVWCGVQGLGCGVQSLGVWI